MQTIDDERQRLQEKRSGNIEKHQEEPIHWRLAIVAVCGVNPDRESDHNQDMDRRRDRSNLARRSHHLTRKK